MRGIERTWRSVLPWITAFAMAMGLLEAAVVVYLRAVAYPEGFAFPLKPLDNKLVITELLREAATLVMLLAPGALLSRKRLERFAWFCWSFAVWDIFYYVFLKLLLGWPGSWLTWDVLFLLPTVWVGPVLAPCMVSVGLMLLAAVILRGRGRNPEFAPARWHWTVLILSGAVMLYTFLVDPVRYLMATAPEHAMGASAMTALEAYVPQSFHWPLFLLACALATVPLYGMHRASRVQRK
ncbi:MAG: hypothetical protein KBH07_05540 [Flavobacteriales bacterium]|nr:hypothetical protein [Flavobacteriales bacterium]